MPREHAIGDVEIFPAIVIEVECIGGPGPATELGSCLERYVGEGAVAHVAEERVAASVTAIDLAHLRGRVGLEARLRRDALPGRGPHVPGIDVQVPIVVVVQEGHAHARAVILDTRRRRHILEARLSVHDAFVVVQVLASEVVGDQQVRPPVLVVIRPHRRKTESIVVLVEAHLIGDLHEPAVAVISEQHIGRSVQRVMVRRRRTGLVFAHADEIAVRTQIEVEEPIAVVVCHRARRQGALQRPLEVKGVGISREAAFTVIAEQ